VRLHYYNGHSKDTLMNAKDGCQGGVRKTLRVIRSIFYCVIALSLVPLVLGSTMLIERHPMLLSLVVPMALLAWAWLRILKNRRWQKEKVKGIDFGLRNEWLSEVPRLLDQNGVIAKKALSVKLVLPPIFGEVARKYDLVKSKKGPTLFSRKLMSELCIKCKDGKDYYCFSGRDEVYYCVRVSSTEETIYKLALEWSAPPVPFASDINHYFALRYFIRDDD
jgi:hypothetical protein